MSSKDRANNLFRFSDGWNTKDLTYSFGNGVEPLSKEIRTIIHDILGEIESYTGLNFTFSKDIGDIAFGQNKQGGSNAYAYYPTNSGRYDKGGDVWLNVDGRDVGDPRFNTYYNMVIRHEVLHSLGLAHSFEVGLKGDEDSYKYTLTSYLKTNTYLNENGRDYYPETFMVYDIAALQTLYGSNDSHNFGATTHELELNKIQTIWDSGGKDTFDASHLDVGVTLDLRPGAHSTVADIQYEDNLAIAYDSWIENAIGSSARDKILGNGKNNLISGQDGRDQLEGKAGRDELYGDRGADVVYGGGGADRLYGNDGEDLVYGGSGSDSLFGGYGGDRLGGAFGNDRLNGGKGSDRLQGGAGSDQLFGANGDDLVRGGDGNDLLNGGKGNDRLYGGKGADIFVFSSGRDRIKDLDDEDRLMIESNLLKDSESLSSVIRQRGDDLILDFGTDKLILDGIGSLNDVTSIDLF